MSKRIFILEGPDGSGKTTLAEQLKKAYDCPLYIHSRTRSRAEFTDLLHQASIEKNGTIFDRLCLSELVYGTIFRERDSIGGMIGYGQIATLQHAIGAQTIVCLPPYDVAFERWAKRAVEGNEFFTDTGIYRKAYDRFDYLAQIEPLALRYDWTAPGAFNALTKALEQPAKPLELLRARRREDELPTVQPTRLDLGL